MLHYLVFIVRRLFLFLLDCSFTVINPVTPCYSVSSFFVFVLLFMTRPVSVWSWQTKTNESYLYDAPFV